MAEMITNIDIRILLFIQEHLRTPAATAFWKFITLFGEHGIFWMALTLFLILWPRTRKTGFTVMISLAMDFVIVNLVIKNLAARPRPYDAFLQMHALVEPLKDFSFPSGHAGASFACALVLVRMLPKRYGIPFVVLASLISFSRLYLGVHYPSDVVAGFLIGAVTSQIAYRISTEVMPRIRRSESHS